MKALEQLIVQTIRERSLFAPNEKVAIAVSGGRDSIALLYALHATTPLHKGDLSIVTIDHGLRPESKRELEWVAQVASGLELPFQPIALNIEKGPNLQERARTARLNALSLIAESKVALGHHQRDQAETVLYRMLRGSGSSGLSGMSHCREPFIRPMLGASMNIIDRYVRERHIDWLEDPSNALSLRGKIRELLPQLNEIHGGVIRALSQSAEILATDDAYLERLCDLKFDALQVDGGLSLKGFFKEPLAIQRRLLRRLCLAEGAPVRLERFDSFLRGLGLEPRHTQLPKGYALIAQTGVIKVILVD